MMEMMLKMIVILMASVVEKQPDDVIGMSIPNSPCAHLEYTFALTCLYRE